MFSFLFSSFGLHRFSSKEERLLFDALPNRVPGEVDAPENNVESTDSPEENTETVEGGIDDPNSGPDEAGDKEAQQRMARASALAERAQKDIDTVATAMSELGSAEGLENAREKGIVQEIDRLSQELSQLRQQEVKARETLGVAEQAAGGDAANPDVLKAKTELGKAKEAVKAKFDAYLDAKKELRSLHRSPPETAADAHLQDSLDAWEDFQETQDIALLMKAFHSFMAYANGEPYEGFENRAEITNQNRRETRQRLRGEMEDPANPQSASELLTSKEKELDDGADGGMKKKLEAAKTAKADVARLTGEKKTVEDKIAAEKAKPANEQDANAIATLEGELQTLTNDLTAAEAAVMSDADIQKLAQDVAILEEDVAHLKSWQDEVKAHAAHLTKTLHAFTEQYGDTLAFAKGVDVSPGEDGVSLAINIINDPDDLFGDSPLMQSDLETAFSNAGIDFVSEEAGTSGPPIVIDDPEKFRVAFQKAVEHAVRSAEVARITREENAKIPFEGDVEAAATNETAALQQLAERYDNLSYLQHIRFVPGEDGASLTMEFTSQEGAESIAQAFQEEGLDFGTDQGIGKDENGKYIVANAELFRSTLRKEIEWHTEILPGGGAPEQTESPEDLADRRAEEQATLVQQATEFNASHDNITLSVIPSEEGAIQLELDVANVANLSDDDLSALLGDLPVLQEGGRGTPPIPKQVAVTIDGQKFTLGGPIEGDGGIDAPNFEDPNDPVAQAWKRVTDRMPPELDIVRPVMRNIMHPQAESVLTYLNERVLGGHQYSLLPNGAIRIDGIPDFKKQAIVEGLEANGVTTVEDGGESITFSPTKEWWNGTIENNFRHNNDSDDSLPVDRDTGLIKDDGGPIEAM